MGSGALEANGSQPWLGVGVTWESLKEISPSEILT